MNYTIENEKLRVVISDFGAELQSIYGKTTEFEYLWQGHPDYWTGKAVNVFPICGRLFDEKYVYNGVTYTLPCHGFAQNQTFEVAEQSDKKIVFALRENQETLKNYPFHFLFQITYSINANALEVHFTVTNTGDKVLPFSVGGHPGFNIPLDNGLDFTDHYLEFNSPCSPETLVLSETCFYTGKNQPYPLKDGKIIPLKHSLFDNDALFLTNVDSDITLKSDKTDRFIRVSYPNMKYLGFWHNRKTKAPFVCIEPWTGVPAIDQEIDDFNDKKEFTYLEPKETSSVYFTVEVNE